MTNASTKLAEEKTLTRPEGAYLLPDLDKSLNELKSEPGALSTSHAPEVVLYVHRNFDGAEWRTNLGWGYVGDNWNDKVSAIIIVSGKWRFYEHRDKGGNHWDLGPGYYAWLPDHGVPNDAISSFQAISW